MLPRSMCTVHNPIPQIWTLSFQLKSQRVTQQCADITFWALPSEVTYKCRITIWIKTIIWNYLFNKYCFNLPDLFWLFQEDKCDFFNFFLLLMILHRMLLMLIWTVWYGCSQNINRPERNISWSHSWLGAIVWLTRGNQLLPQSCWSCLASL